MRTRYRGRPHPGAKWCRDHGVLWLVPSPPLQFWPQRSCHRDRTRRGCDGPTRSDARCTSPVCYASIRSRFFASYPAQSESAHLRQREWPVQRAGRPARTIDPLGKAPPQHSSGRRGGPSFGVRLFSQSGPVSLGRLRFFRGQHSGRVRDRAKLAGRSRR